MAFAAVTSLKYTINGVLNSSRISIDNSTENLLEYASQGVKWLQEALERNNIFKTNSEGVMALEARIRDEARKIEDTIESQLSSQIISQSQSHDRCPPTLSLDLDHLSRDFNSYAQTAFVMCDEYEDELRKSFSKEESDAIDDDADVVDDATDADVAVAVDVTAGADDDASDADVADDDATEADDDDDSDVFVADYEDMVGLSDQFLSIRRALINENERTTAWLRGMGSIILKKGDRVNVTISGMAGIGKTRLARKLYDDLMVMLSFKCRAFVSVGKNYDLKEIMKDMIAQLNHVNKEVVFMGDEDLDDLRSYLNYILTERRYLIVFDDVWDERDYGDNIEGILPHNFEGSRILVIGRDKMTGRSASEPYFAHEMRFLSEEESWELLQKQVFGEEGCPYILEKAGKKIAENCEGLPLLILKIADHLSESPKNREYWNEVAEKKNSVFEEAYDQMSEVLSPSYHYLPQNLKACFLYMGVFPPGYAAPSAKIINLWRAERFLEVYYRENKIPLGDKFYDFVSTNLVVVRQRSSSGNNVKTCSLHSAYRYQCKREIENSKFLNILDRADDAARLMESARILAIYKNILLAVKEVYDSVASISTVRSVVCAGAYHRYQVPLCLEHWRLLRVLDALTIRFYEFPLEVVKLIRLRYLALTCSADLPRSISKLWSLECLIMQQHLSIKQDVAQSYLPVDIWDLKELKYLEITGRNLPDPPPGAVLRNLRKLVDVGVQSCTKRVLERIPDLKKLRIRILDLAPDDADQAITCFDQMPYLEGLKSLQSVILNPEIPLFEPTAAPPLLPISISSLRKLSLSGFGYPWEDMSNIAAMRKLEMLKLQCYAFRGEEWEVEEEGFQELKYLLIEDTDLVKWRVGDETFPLLSRLTMKNCYNLQEIPLFSSLLQQVPGTSAYLNLQLVDCNPLAEASAKRRFHYVNASYSWK